MPSSTTRGNSSLRRSEDRGKRGQEEVRGERADENKCNQGEARARLAIECSHQAIHARGTDSNGTTGDVHGDVQSRRRRGRAAEAPTRGACAGAEHQHDKGCERQIGHPYSDRQDDAALERGHDGQGDLTQTQEPHGPQRNLDADGPDGAACLHGSSHLGGAADGQDHADDEVRADECGHRDAE